MGGKKINYKILCFPQDAFKLCSLRARNKVSHIYKTTGKI
jgi:hypothetical protein